jgi:serine/threonine-protein kinase
MRYPGDLVSAFSHSTKTCPRCQGRFESDSSFCPRDGARLTTPEESDAAPNDPYLGTVIGGDIVVQSIAGGGAMGRVYRAHQRGVDRDVAVKILHRELSSNAQVVARFHREAKIVSKLQHAHVVEVFLAGQLPDGALYMVMEFLDGVSLAGALHAANGAFMLERTLSIALQICDAVGEGHARGIVHRDLKPENIMLIRRAEVAEWVKVLDFGIAKLTVGEQSMETAAGLIFGTARYISPEGAQGGSVGPPGDVYGIATIVYQMLAGRVPFEAEPLGLLVKHIHETPPDVRTVSAASANVPAPIARVVMENLAKNPDHRAPDARTFASALAAAAREAHIAFADLRVAARMSHVPTPSVSATAVALDPTLDDGSAVVAPAVPAPGTALPPAVAAPPRSPEQSGNADVDRDAPQAQAAARPPERRSFPASLLVLLAFLSGSALTAFLIFRLVRPDAARRTYEERTRAALAEGHYITPPNENVRDLVAAGMKQWPDDVDLRQMRSAAEKEMITMAMTARASGDLVGARNLSRDALSLEGTDNSARTMRAVCDEELRGALSGATAKSGPPRILFEAPPTAKPHERVELTGRIVWGAAGPTAPVSGMTLSLLPNGKTVGGISVDFASADPNAIRAVLTAPPPGSYDVAFEANVAGTIVRAMRDLDVIP